MVSRSFVLNWDSTGGIELLQERYSFDAEYVRRLSEGDQATEVHFAEYFGDLIQIKATARLRSPQAADDVKQETLLRVIRNLKKGSIEHPERLGAYVNTVCNHVILETFRRDRRLNQFPEDYGDVPSSQASAESLMLKREQRHRVMEALEQLSPKDRELLRRIFLEEQDKDSVCAEFQVTREYLRVLLHRSRQRLRETLTKGMRSSA
jgi:RNA polymerase sigma-70 factor (ECF subfamily)